jgi:hypothetical protein
MVAVQTPLGGGAPGESASLPANKLELKGYYRGLGSILAGRRRTPSLVLVSRIDGE